MMHAGACDVNGGSNCKKAIETNLHFFTVHVNEGNDTVTTLIRLPRQSGNVPFKITYMIVRNRYQLLSNSFRAKKPSTNLILHVRDVTVAVVSSCVRIQRASPTCYGIMGSLCHLTIHGDGSTRITIEAPLSHSFLDRSSRSREKGAPLSQ